MRERPQVVSDRPKNFLKMIGHNSRTFGHAAMISAGLALTNEMAWSFQK
jgi:hypothetical protein